MPGFVIALVGAESTGKSTLARQLCEALEVMPAHDTQGAHGTQGDMGATLATTSQPRCARVDETLRSFCDRHGRTPTCDEQAGIAAEQTRRIAAAAASHALVVADTSALMTAVYSDHVFGDTRLYDTALASQRDYGLTLLTALDLPWQPDGLQRDGAQVRPPVDRLVRQALRRAGLGWSVIAGQGPARLANALAAVHRALAHAADSAPSQGASDEHAPGWAPRDWRHVCQRCGDGSCERQLLALRRRALEL
jgi:nicotinamide riboside kinase